MAIHRAIYGSLERFIGILVEHFAGAFPLWIAPVQAVVIPIADRHVEAAQELAAELRAAGAAVRRGRRLRQPDAEQDPPGAGPEGAVHADPGRPRGRGADGVRPAPRRDEGRAPGDAGLGGPGRPPGGGDPGATSLPADASKRPRRIGCRLLAQRAALDVAGGGTWRGLQSEVGARRPCRGPPRGVPFRCRRSNPRAILPRRPRRSWDRARRAQHVEQREPSHQPRPAHQPDDPCPPGAGPR